ncbi:MAG TPA: VapC toxin family PIN domain ribonuclease [Chloroflexota bacterium]|nr:VapC toxin family PIN domain ribonuclease [Chloroflexota bacterium]
MTLIVDAGPLIALVDRDDPLRPIVRRILREEPGQLILPAQVSAEVDYLVSRRLGRAARLAYLQDLADGNLDVVCLEPGDYRLVLEYDRQYADLDLGLADISLVILARRFNTRRLLTFDERHFRAVRPLDGGSFVLLPRDAS